MKKLGKKGLKGLDCWIFICQVGVVVVGMIIVFSIVVFGLGYVMLSDKLNIVGVGVGGMGCFNFCNMNF